MLLSLQVLQDSDCGLRVVAGDVPQDEHMVRRLHYGVPVLCHPVVIVLRPIQLVVRKRQLILSPPDWIRVSLIPKVNVRNVEVVVQGQSRSFGLFTTQSSSSASWGISEGVPVEPVLPQEP